MKSVYHFLSLGAGVQSSTLALMAAKGEVQPMPDAAIFADTQAEPDEVYEWLNWLEMQLPFPLYRVTKGNLYRDALTIRRKRDTKEFYVKAIIPAFTKDPSGMLFRTCTVDYKVNVLVKKANELRQNKDSLVIFWLGISTDEAFRVKHSLVDWITNRYPLIEKGFSRQDCLDWMVANGYPKPPKSACVFCPYHNDKEWLRLKTESPKSFAKAVEFEKKLQELAAKTTNMKGTPFLHRTLVSLDKVNFSETDNVNRFINECAGACGV